MINRISLSAALVFAVLCTAALATAEAKTVKGNKQDNVLRGTNKGDRISGRAGDDKLKGRAGKDRLKAGKGKDLLLGGKGRDKLRAGKGADQLRGGKGHDMLFGSGGRDLLIGGKGSDRLLGGSGKDTLRSADGARDKLIAGGAGANTCIIDTDLELDVTTGCAVIRDGGRSGVDGPGDGVIKPGDDDPATNELHMTRASGLSGCEQETLPLCLFRIDGYGAEQLLGADITGEGGVTVGLDANVSIQNDGEFTALGGYSCTADGFILITNGSRSLRVPVDCGSD